MGGPMGGPPPGYGAPPGPGMNGMGGPPPMRFPPPQQAGGPGPPPFAGSPGASALPLVDAVCGVTDVLVLCRDGRTSSARNADAASR